MNVRNPSQERHEKATLGFRVKSGWASAVVLVGPVKKASVLEQRMIDLCDPGMPESRQPYHAATGTLERDAEVIAKRIAVVKHAAGQSVDRLLNDARRQAPMIRTAALVVGSLIEPDSIGNQHIRAHAFEGRLFRTALEDCLRSHGLSTVVVVERNVYQEARAVLHQSEAQLKKRLSDFGRSLKPWRTDEKLAALAAWIALARKAESV